MKHCSGNENTVQIKLNSYRHWQGVIYLGLGGSTHPFVPFDPMLVGIQFLLRQAFADDEASTRLLQILLFLLLSTAPLMFILCAIRSSFTLSIHFFGCHPLRLVPSTCPYSATTGIVCFPPS